MKFKFTIAAIILLHVISIRGAAQNIGLKFNLVEGPHGKPLGKINAITQDPHGYMWFAGNGKNCIYRYDAIRMISFTHDEANPNSLGIDHPETIYADDKGMIWIGGNGLDQYDPATGIFKHYRHLENDSSSLGGYVMVILKDHRGRLWVGTGSGLDRLDEKTGKFIHYHNEPGNQRSLSSNIVRAIYEDHEGVLWIGTGFEFNHDEDGGLNRLNPDGTFTRYLHDPNNPHSLINNKVKAIFEDSRGIFWVGTAGDGLHTMDREKGSFERHLYDPSKPDQLSRPPVKKGFSHIIFINEDKSGAIWIGTYNAGINRYDPVTKKITHYQTSNAPADSTCWNDFISSDGVLWIATEDSYLLYRVDPFHKTIRSVSTVDEAHKFLEDKQGYLWIGTRGSGLFKYDQQLNLIQQFKHNPSDSLSLPDNTVGSLFQNQENAIWVETHKGIRVLDEATQNFSRFNERENLKIFDDSGAAYIFQDKQGLIWFARWGQGLVRYNPKDHSINHFYSKEKDSSSISSNNVGQIFEDRSGVLWAGSDNGLNRLDKKTGKFVRYSVGNDWALYLYQDSEGDLWAGADQGLYRYDKKEDRFLNFFDPQSELNSVSFGGVTEDGAKNLWFFSQSAIISLNLVTNQIFIYGSKYGIVPYSMASWKAAYKNRKGQIFIPNGIGFYTFLPAELVAKTDFKIIITDFFINTLPVLPGKGSLLQKPIEEISDIDLKYNQNNITFNFAAIDYRQPETIRYFTMLEGYDNIWREVIGEKVSNYFNLSQGKYIYRIKAFNSDGTKAEKAITIHINPPWWETWWAYTLYALLLIVAISAFIKWRTGALKKEKIILEEKVTERTKELQEEKELVESTLSELKSTQAQLIQSEKMASLGELTAGIAHEIQNPLNFVNNFSEVNTELIEELKNEKSKDKNERDEQLENELLNDIASNEQKINLHGKRADAIVKGMLQHSRSSSGIKEPTDINALTDEYFRLAYHGLRAKDKSFNATMKTDFDKSIGNVNIIPQDIGRVLLNLYNNAFYAVTEKKKQLGDAYEPTVSVSTKKTNNKIEIKVIDNGNGIPQKVLDKIFQPFFTTKPAGQGTGLGLSLSYDIIKAHGGEIKVESKEKDGTEFLIQLPSM